ncbi:glycosyltransferase involved in cell wall biosynthesis [Trinickia symbiotica]|uniref:Glycosyltransferase family 1 protein n=1 Tax=Trinickia symbiotica TaxID=863227 RepID=A0A2N7X5M1_9BURK|nr:glycosyltransferase family 1 protein [Trinickia symbiotica]PMS36910.1 glycosyltransferase family 1 protein [Trinickia symbiotica]PPK45302.1 glycosyltransferase involved in cell wall biosynthesis [Trinickia symbiotica]
MRIVIDLQAAQSESRFRGIGRYSLSLALAMVADAERRGHEVYVVLNGKFPETIEPLRTSFAGLLSQDRILVFSSLPETEGVTPGSEWRRRASEFVREEFLAALRPDVLHVSSLFEGWGDESVVAIDCGSARLPTAVTLYDLIPYVMSEAYLVDSGYRSFYLRKLEQLKRADYLLAISAHSRLEAIDLLHISADRVINISAAIGDQFKPAPISEEAARELLLAEHGIANPFVLYVPGGFDPRKNLDRLIEAFASLPMSVRDGLQLVIGSKVPEGMGEALQAKARSVGLGPNQLVLTDYVPDEQLTAIYGLCQFCVFPSLHEGFGLPALEAMACGAPVIASNSTSLPEVIGFDEGLFDPLSVADIARVMLRCLTDDGFLLELKRHCALQVKKFSWERSALLALDGFEGAFEGAAAALSRIDDQTVANGYERIAAELKRDSAELGREASDAEHTMLRECLRMNQRVIDRACGERQLLVDISELVNRDAKSGIQRVVRSILLRLLKHPPAGYRVEAVYTKDGHGLLYAKSFVAKFLGLPTEGVQDVPITFGKDDIFVGLDLTAHLFPAFNETLRQLEETGVHIHYVVYDLTPLMNTRWHTTGMTQAFTHWIDGLASYADSLICISEAVAHDVERWFEEKRPGLGRTPRISHFHLGADIGNSQPTVGLPENASQVLAAIKSVPSFLMVGTIEPRKGYTQAIDAFESLWSKGENVNLVIVGKAGWHMEEVVDRLRGHPQAGTRLFWLEGVSDEYLDRLYETTSALIAASEYEGFGLPLVEAAQRELPIIARNIPVFKEVAGNHAFWFDGHDGVSLARALLDWLELYRMNEVPRSAGMPWLTWEQSTDQLLRRVDVSLADMS